MKTCLLKFIILKYYVNNINIFKLYLCFIFQYMISKCKLKLKKKITELKLHLLYKNRNENFFKI